MSNHALKLTSELTWPYCLMIVPPQFRLPDCRRLSTFRDVSNSLGKSKRILV